MMNRIMIVLISIFALLLPAALPHSVSALDIFGGACDEATADSEVCTANTTNPVSGTEGVILGVVNILSFVIGVAAVIMVILGGLKYITSNGDANSISAAKNTVLYALIGLVVAASAQVIVRFIVSNF